MKVFNHLIIISILLILNVALAAQKFTKADVKCQVCKGVIKEMIDGVTKIDPHKTVEVGGFRLDSSGNAIRQKKSLTKSEMFLTELMEKVCERMNDYVRVTDKKTGKLSLMNLMVNGMLNPEASEVDIVQDDDLNKSINLYCLEIIEIQEEPLMTAFQADTLDENLDIKICTEIGNYCQDAPVEVDYDFGEKEEL
uniref:DUF3456 domain-containing protein n=1 Tax=Glossina brevipalpis TaxID=37001 RepID=A0A1A9X3Q9_9MUSC